MKIKAKTIASIFKAISQTSFATKATEDKEELNSVKIVSETSLTRIISTNSKVSVECTIPGLTGNITGTFENKTLPGLIEAAADAEGNVELMMKNGTLFAVGGAQVPINNAPQKDTGFLSVDGVCAAKVMAGDLVKAIKATNIACLPSNEIMGCIKTSFDPYEATFKMLSVNGKMMAEANIPLEDMDIIEKEEILISAEILKSIINVLEIIKKEMVDIIFQDGRLMISSENMKIVIPYKTGDFVNCDNLLKANFTKDTTCSVKKIKGAINTAYKAVKDVITFSSDGVTTCLCKGDFSIDFDVDTPIEMEFSIPIKQMIDVVRNIDSSNMEISLAGNVLLKMAADDDSTSFVMGTMKKEN